MYKRQLRGQHAGALAFYQGANAEALERLEHTLGLGVRSKLFDALSLVLIALLRFDAGDQAGVLAMRRQLSLYRQRFPGSVRLQRLELAARLLVDLQQGAQEAAVADLGQLDVYKRQQLTQALERNRVVAIAPPPGTKFDPHQHQAISVVPAEQDANTVVMVLQKGYLIADRVLRPALVTVAAPK